MPDAQFDWTRAKLLNLDATLTKQNFLAFLEDLDDTEKNRGVNRSQARRQMSLRTAKKEPQSVIDEEQHKKEPQKRNTAPLLIGQLECLMEDQNTFQRLTQKFGEESDKVLLSLKVLDTKHAILKKTVRQVAMKLIEMFRNMIRDSVRRAVLYEFKERSKTDPILESVCKLKVNL